MLKKTILVGTMLAGFAAAGVPAAMAENNDEASELKLVEAATVTAAEAATTVAAKEGGKVSSVQIADVNGKTIYHVEVVSGGKQKDFAVDATSGEVSPMTSNGDEHDGGGEGEDQE